MDLPEWKPSPAQLPDAGRHLRTWLLEQAGPLWLANGVDRSRGGFFDQLTPDTAENACDFKRLRVTSRQIFVFAELDRLGLAGARQAMEHGLVFLFERLRHPDGGFIRSATLDGAPLDRRRDLYDLAFTLFGLAAAYRRTGEPRLVEEAEILLGFIQARFAHPAGGFVEALPPSLPRRQNPHMHLLEACLAWLPLTSGPGFREQARQLLTLFETYFFKPDEGCLFEYFAEDWAVVGDSACQVFEPGHHCEWIWLLGECEAAALAVPDAVSMLARTVRTHGIDPGTGLPYAEVHRDGRVADANCRLWTVTEWLRACVTHPVARLGSIAAPLAHLERFLGAARPGLWAERWDAAAGRFPSEPVPASTLYHIVTGIRPLIG